MTNPHSSSNLSSIIDAFEGFHPIDEQIKGDRSKTSNGPEADRKIKGDRSNADS